MSASRQTQMVDPRELAAEAIENVKGQAPLGHALMQALDERDALKARLDAALTTVEVWAQNADARSIVEYTRGECARIVRAALTGEAS